MGLMLLVVALALLAVRADAQGYRFPDRFENRAWGWVSDTFVNGRTAFSSGYQFTDYVAGVQRIDEVWNVTSVNGTMLWESGIRYDTHLFLGASPLSPGYIYWNGEKGAQCLKTASGLLAQDAFAANGPVRVEPVDGIKCNVYVQASPIFNLTLWVDVSTNNPVQLYVGPNHLLGWFGSQVRYDDFRVVSDPFPDGTFAAPSYCKTSSTLKAHMASMTARAAKK